MELTFLSQTTAGIHRTKLSWLKQNTKRIYFFAKSVFLSFFPSFLKYFFLLFQLQNFFHQFICFIFRYLNENLLKHVSPSLFLSLKTPSVSSSSRPLLLHLHGNPLMCGCWAKKLKAIQERSLVSFDRESKCQYQSFHYLALSSEDLLHISCKGTYAYARTYDRVSLYTKQFLRLYST